MSIDLEAIQKRADAATEGPWSAREVGLPGSEYIVVESASPFKAFTTPEAILGMHWPAHSAEELSAAEKLTEDTAQFIAHAREDIPVLLSALRESREKLAEAEKRIERLAQFHVPPDHEHESDTPNPDGDCWVCFLQKPVPTPPTEAPR